MSVKGCAIAMNALVRSALLRLLAASLLYAAATVLMDVTVASFTGDALTAVSVASTVVALALFVVVVLFEVRAYRAVSECAQDAGNRVGERFEGSGKVLLALTLWFAGGLPMNLVSLGRGAMVGASSTGMEPLFLQLGVTVVLVAFCWLRLHDLVRAR